jgi:hypothetical protein
MSEGWQWRIMIRVKPKKEKEEGLIGAHKQFMLSEWIWRCWIFLEPFSFLHPLTCRQWYPCHHHHCHRHRRRWISSFVRLQLQLHRQSENGDKNNIESQSQSQHVNSWKSFGKMIRNRTFCDGRGWNDGAIALTTLVIVLIGKVSLLQVCLVTWSLKNDVRNSTQEKYITKIVNQQQLCSNQME